MQAAEQAVPEGLVSGMAWGGDHMAVSVEVALPDGGEVNVWIDPVSGTVQGLSHGMSFRWFLRALHGWLLVYPVGWYAVSLLGLPLLGSLITGVVVYKRFWRAFFQPHIRLRKGMRVALGDIHRVGGTWSLWFLGLMAITGLWFLINTLLWDLGVPWGAGKAPVMVSRQDVPVAATLPRLDPDRVLQAATAAVPDMRVRYLAWPESAFSPARVFGTSGQAPLLPDTIQVNPYRYQVMEVAGGFDRPAAQLTGIVMRALHTGDFGGLPIKLIWLSFGVILSILVLSGMLIWTRRTVKATQDWVAERRAQGRGVFFTPRSRYHLSALVLLLPLPFVPDYLATTPRVNDQELRQALAVGPFALTVVTADEPPEQGPGGTQIKEVEVELSASHRGQIRAVFLRVGPPRSERTLGSLAEGDGYHQEAHVRLPPHPSLGPLPAGTVPQDDRLWITVETWEGDRHQAPLEAAFLYGESR